MPTREADRFGPGADPARDRAQTAPLLRAIKLLRGHEVDAARVVDTVVLNHQRRRHCHGTLLGTKGTHFIVDFAESTPLRGGDALMLAGGDLVEVVAEAEALIEVRAADITALARIAWALGDRHAPAQILADRLRFCPDPTLEALLRDLGAKTEAVVAPFDPEGGAYGSADRGHDHHPDTPGKPSST